MKEAPINPLPLVVWALALSMIAMELVMSLGATGLTSDPAAIGWRLSAVEGFGFFPGILRAMVEQNVWPWQHVIRLLTYPFIHGSITHALFAVVILLALGKMVAEAFRAWAVLAVFFASAIVGACVYTLIPWAEQPIFGAYPPVYGLIGAFTFLLWVKLAGSGAQYRAFSLIGLLLGVQLLFGALFGGTLEWVADLAGFATGFLMSFVVSPGGAARVMEKIRQR
ncbi:rhomboid family intramembrane serine protease [Falsirhodobacter xinxiangensis]|uniref:rhomboid family intramembrane serine protease n=1 Tax=Falsirhodobacter xinxiangensis TaxID=2530049 RepID=UPI0010A9EF9B|nr:rhomboid family intramembrane serine protease [Rhodobacter xinxiangensis]